jgi:hypothetical protein
MFGNVRGVGGAERLNGAALQKGRDAHADAKSIAAGRAARLYRGPAAEV